MKKLTLLLLVFLLVCGSFRCASADAREMKIINMDGYYDRLKLREKPSTNSKILGQYYAGVIVTVHEDQGKWVNVKIGNEVGYMRSEFLTGESIDYATEGMWGIARFAPDSGMLSIYEEPSSASDVVAQVPQGQYVNVLGTYDQGWLHISYAMPDGERVYGYGSSTAITETDNLAQVCVTTAALEDRLNLREGPSRDAKIMGRYFAGTQAYRLFDPANAADWERIRVGDQVGYFDTRYLGYGTAGPQACRPPLAQPTEDTRPNAYVSYLSNTPLFTLSPNLSYAVIATRGDRLQVMVDSGTLGLPDYYWIIASEIPPVTRAVSTEAVLSKDTPLYNKDGTAYSEQIDLKKGQTIVLYGDYKEGILPGYIYAQDEYVYCAVSVMDDYGRSSFYEGYVPLEYVTYDPLMEYPEIFTRG